MVQIDISHRSVAFDLTLGDYEACASSLASAIAKHPSVSGLVLCGSLAKGDAVPGWSDIDIIAFCHGGGVTGDFLLSVQQQIDRDLPRRIGIGFDPCDIAKFSETRKIGGRPLMMSYEVGRYGKTLFGENPLVNLEYDKAARSLVDYERKLLISSELHSARRVVANMSCDAAGTERATQLLAKSMLRLLQCETGPNLTPPISTQGSLGRMRTRSPSHPALFAYETAVELRGNWSRAYLSDHAARMFEIFISALETYPG